MQNTHSQLIQATSQGILLNPSFKGCTDLIEKNGHPQALSETAIYNYSGKKDQVLLEKAINHTIKHQRLIKSDNVLVYVHPFYLHLNCIDKLIPQKRYEANNYLINSLNFLNKILSYKKDLQIVAFETLQHYWAGTNILLEQGIFDRVVFTAYDCGVISSHSDVRDLEDKNIYYAGCGNNACLSGAISSLNKRVVVNNKFAILELCLNQPDISRSLIPEKIELDTDIESPLISLNMFYNLLEN